MPPLKNKNKKTQKTKNKTNLRRAWVVQLVKHMTLDFSSGHDLTVYETRPHVRLWADSAEPAWDSLSPSVSAPPPFMPFLSLSN